MVDLVFDALEKTNFTGITVSSYIGIILCIPIDDAILALFEIMLAVNSHSKSTQ